MPQANAKSAPVAVPPALQEQLLPVAKKVFWWGTPAEAMQNMHRFVAQVMTFGDWEDVQRTLSLLGEEIFRQVLADPPPGVFDKKSWSYWHHFFKKTPVPPLPKRKL